MKDVRFLCLPMKCGCSEPLLSPKPRMAIICDSMPAVRRSRFRRFVEGLRLDERTEFGEGCWTARSTTGGCPQMKG